MDESSMVKTTARDRARTYSAIISKPRFNNKWMLNVSTSHQFIKGDFNSFNSTNQLNNSCSKQMYSFPKSARKFTEPHKM